MSRWSYIFPRLIILALISLALWMGADPLTRAMIVSGLQQTTGSKVEVGQLRCSIRNEKVFLKDVAIADPSDPLINLAQADMVYVEIDSNALLHRSIVITGGQTSRLMFGTPRTTDGKLPQQTIVERTPFKSLGKSASFSATIGQRWLDQLEPLPTSLAAVENQSLFTAAKHLDQTWTQRLSQIQAEINSVQSTTNTIGSTIERYDGNVLRWENNNHVQLKNVETATSLIKAKLKEYRTTLADDLKQLNRAADIDASRIENSIQTTSFNSDDMSNLLLAELHAEHVDDVMTMFRWFRHNLPEPTEFAAKFQRGQDIPLQGIQKQPRFVAKSIDLNGEGKFFDRHYNFSGKAFNLTAEPQLLDEPTRFELRAQGEKHVIVDCVLDRRTETPVDTLSVICPELDTAARTLGDKSSLQVSMGPSGQVQADVKLKVVGDEISGTITIRHADVSLHVDKLNDLAGGAAAALQMNEGGLGLIKQFESEIQISGTVDNYHHVAKSDLGVKFSTAVNSIFAEKKRNSIAMRKKMLQETKRLQLQSFNERIVLRLEKLNQSLRANGARVAELQTVSPSTSRINNHY